jgi:hypothetical protein
MILRKSISLTCDNHVGKIGSQPRTFSNRRYCSGWNRTRLTRQQPGLVFELIVYRWQVIRRGWLSGHQVILRT